MFRLLIYTSYLYYFQSSTCNALSTRIQQQHLLFTEESVLSRNQGVLDMKDENERSMIKREISSSIDSKYDTNLYAPEKDASGFGAVLMKDGVARINNILSEKTANNMLKYVKQKLEQTRKKVVAGEISALDRFGNVHNNEQRWDLLLPLEEDDMVLECLHEIFYNSPVLSTIESVFGEDDSKIELYELATLMSDPGSKAQPLHPDIPYQSTSPPSLTCFVSLQDISPEMGPTLFMPGSVSPEFHYDLQNRHLDPEAKGLVATSYNTLSLLGTGDVSIYNPMVLHCGTSNRSLGQRRSLFYFSFRHNDIYKDGCRSGASIRPELKERKLSLKDLKTILKHFEQSKNIRY